MQIKKIFYKRLNQTIKGFGLVLLSYFGYYWYFICCEIIGAGNETEWNALMYIGQIIYALFVSVSGILIFKKNIFGHPYSKFRIQLITLTDLLALLSPYVFIKLSFNKTGDALFVFTGFIFLIIFPIKFVLKRYGLKVFWKIVGIISVSILILRHYTG